MNPETKLCGVAVAIGVLGCALIVAGLGGPRTPLASLAVGVVCVCVALSLFTVAWRDRS